MNTNNNPTENGSVPTFADQQRRLSSEQFDKIQSDPSSLDDPADDGSGDREEVQDLSKFPRAFDEAEAAGLLADVKASFDRSNKGAYATLGLIHEARDCFPIARNAHDVLVTAVKKSGRVSEARSLDGRPAYLLFLDLLFGTENKRSQKTQWRTALEVAADERVPASQSLFIEWIETNGGIAGVGEMKQKQPAAKAVNVIDAANKLSQRFEGVFTLPPVKDAAPDHGLFASISVRLPDDYNPNEEAPVTIIGVNFTAVSVEEQIRKLYRRTETSADRETRKAISSEDAPYLEALKKLRRKYTADRKKKLTRHTPEEYIDEKLSAESDAHLRSLWDRRDFPSIWRALRLG